MEGPIAFAGEKGETYETLQPNQGDGDIRRSTEILLVLLSLEVVIVSPPRSTKDLARRAKAKVVLQLAVCGPALARVQ